MSAWVSGSELKIPYIYFLYGAKAYKCRQREDFKQCERDLLLQKKRVLILLNFRPNNKTFL